MPLHRLCRHRQGGAVRDRSAARPRYRARTGRRAKDPGAGRLRSKRRRPHRAHAGRSAANRHRPMRVGSISSIPDLRQPLFWKQHFTVAHPPEQVFAMFGDIAAVAACLPGASLTAPPTAGARRGGHPRQDRPDCRDVPRSRAGRTQSGRYVRPHRRHRQRPAQPVFDARRNPLPAGAGRAGHPRRSFHRIHAHGNAGAGREAGAGARSRGAIDRGICRQSRSPAVGRAGRCRAGRVERNGAGFGFVARAGRAMARAAMRNDEVWTAVGSTA